MTANKRAKEIKNPMPIKRQELTLKIQTKNSKGTENKNLENESAKNLRNKK